ncbi:MAG: SdpI family protein [Firmicutes bacterium]|nr:SdpI family protein [Bacillota bacterium]
MIGFWFFILFACLISPIIMIIGGNVFIKKAPQDINFVYGFRTKLSMKNPDTWKFAHAYCGRLWLKFGIMLLPVSILPLVFVFGQSYGPVSIVGCIILAVQILPLVISVSLTNKALAANFDENGNRRTK